MPESNSFGDSLGKLWGSVKKSGSKKQQSNAAKGAAIGGIVGSIIPGIGNAIGAAIGGAIGFFAKGGVHDSTNTEEVIKGEINGVHNAALARVPDVNTAQGKFKLALELVKAYQAKIDHAYAHGNNSKSKSGREHHKARREVFTKLRDVAKVEAAKLASARNSSGGKLGMFSRAKQSMSKQTQAAKTQVLRNQGKAPQKQPTKVERVVSNIAGASAILGVVVSTIKAIKN